MESASPTTLPHSTADARALKNARIDRIVGRAVVYLLLYHCRYYLCPALLLGLDRIL